MHRHRVAFAVFQTGRRANGGVESITGIVERLRGRVRPTLITQRHGEISDRWRSLGGDAFYCWLPYEIGDALSTSGFTERCGRIASLVTSNLTTFLIALTRRVSALHCNDPSAFWHCALGARLAGVPVVLNLRDTKEGGAAAIGARYTHAFRLSAALIVLSREMRSFWRMAVPWAKAHSGFPIIVTYSVVDFSRHRPRSAAERAKIRNRLGCTRALTVACVGAVCEKKGQLDFICRAIPDLLRLAPEAEVVFVGDCDYSPYASACRTAAIPFGPAVRFIGYTAEVEDWYAAADVVVIVSRQEGLARCMIEAMANGTPVVSFDVSSAKEVLCTSGGGVVIEQGNFTGVVEALVMLRSDAALRLSMGRRAAHASQRLFPPEKVASRYLRCYLRLSGSTHV